MSHRHQTRIQTKPHAKFSDEDDENLKNLVEQFGEAHWPVIANHMLGRNSRQCRERWNNYLSPKLNTAEWTQEEDDLLLERYDEFGPRWVMISKYLIGRTDQMVKNRYCVLQRKITKHSKHTKKSKSQHNGKSKSTKNHKSTSTKARGRPAKKKILEEDSCNEIDQLRLQQSEIEKQQLQNQYEQIQQQPQIQQKEQQPQIQQKEQQPTIQLFQGLNVAVKEVETDKNVLEETLKFLQMTTEEDWENFNNTVVCDIFSLY